jgi:hypothetical protein
MPSIDLKSEFDIILRDTITPFFKLLGFKKQGQNFARTTNDLTQCFNVQKSQWNSYDSNVSFTFNFGFYNSEIRSIAWNKKVSLSFPKTIDCFVNSRVGIFSHNSDHWYELNAGLDNNQVVLDIKHDLESHVKEIFEASKSLEELAQFIKRSDKQNVWIFPPYDDIVFLMATGQSQEGKFFLITEYSKAIVPQTTTHTTRYPDGRIEVKTSKPYVNKHYIEQLERLAKYYNVDLDETKNASR